MKTSRSSETEVELTRDMVVSGRIKQRTGLDHNTVQFRMIRHPYVSVTHLTKFSFRHLARELVTG